MKHKILLSIIITIFFAFLTACTSPKTEYKNLVFDSYYVDATHYSDLAPLIADYLYEIEIAYNDSDKQDYSSFTLPDKCKTNMERIRDIIKRYDDITDIIFVQYIYTIEIRLSDLDSGNIHINPEYMDFSTFGELIDEAYLAYENVDNALS